MSALHCGQVVFLRTHDSIHTRWYLCSHGSSLTQDSSSGSRQMAQLSLGDGAVIGKLAQSHSQSHSLFVCVWMHLRRRYTGVSVWHRRAREQPKTGQEPP